MKRRLILGGSILAVAAAAYILGWSTLFTVSAVEIKGTSTQITSGIVQGQKLARVEPRAVAATIEKLEWVAGAKVSRNWINGTVTIEITERTPVAIFNNMVIDSTGQSFMLRGKAPQNLVQIQAGDLKAATEAVTFFVSLPEEIRSSLTLLKVRSNGAMVLSVNNSGKNLEIRWGLDGDNELKIKVYKAVIALPENATIKRVDVSAPHAPIVK
jgi:cell division septal protein FtsQ